MLVDLSVKFSLVFFGIRDSFSLMIYWFITAFLDDGAITMLDLNAKMSSDGTVPGY